MIVYACCGLYNFIIQSQKKEEHDILTAEEEEALKSAKERANIAIGTRDPR
jgi:hypothetical protein